VKQRRMRKEKKEGRKDKEKKGVRNEVGRKD
jgi:hypothetical protein